MSSKQLNNIHISSIFHVKFKVVTLEDLFIKFVVTYAPDCIREGNRIFSHCIPIHSLLSSLILLFVLLPL